MLGFLTVIFVVVVILLARFSQGVIRDESMDSTRQSLENMALRINNILRQSELTARLEHKPLTIDKALIERLLQESNYRVTISQSLPNARLFVLDTATDCLGSPNPSNLFFQVPVAQNVSKQDRYRLVIDGPIKDIYSNYSGEQMLLIVTSIVGMLILFYTLYLVIAHPLRPLHRLADAAQHIANGHLDTSIPDSRQIDEIGQLQNSLSKMQRSLTVYMDEMQQKQAELNRQHRELQAAYDEAKDYERLKASFLHDMTGRMASPVETVCRHTETICSSYMSLSTAQMAKLQIDILSATDTITQLLDQLISSTSSATRSDKTEAFYSSPATTATP